MTRPAPRRSPAERARDAANRAEVDAATEKAGELAEPDAEVTADTADTPAPADPADALEDAAAPAPAPGGVGEVVTTEDTRETVTAVVDTTGGTGDDDR